MYVATRTIRIALSQKLYDELAIAAADSSELDEEQTVTPEDFAKECVESILASRRLNRIDRLATA